MKFRLLVILLLLTGCQSAPPPIAPDFAFLRVNVIDVSTGEITPDQTVLITGDTIVATGDFATTVIPKDVATIFAEGQYLMPGLTDSHVHAFQSVEESTTKTLPLFVAHGITQIRDTGAELEKLEKTKDALQAAPNLVHPKLMSTGPLIDSKKLSWYGDLQLIIDDPTDVPAAVTRLEANGVTQLKVYTNLDPNIYQAVADEARLRGLRIVGHVPIGVSLSDAAAARQLSIEHLDTISMLSCANDDKNWFAESLKTRFAEGNQSYFEYMAHYWTSMDWQACAPALESFAASGGYWTPTLVMETGDIGLVDDTALNYLAPGARDWCEADLAGIQEASPDTQHAAYSGLKQALDHIRAANIPLLAGSDTPNNCLAPGASLIWELIRMAGFGLTNLEAIQTATINPALAFTGAAKLVRAGDPAELILLEDNPLENLTALKQIEGVYINGRWIDSDQLDELKQAAIRYAKTQTAD